MFHRIRRLPARGSWVTAVACILLIGGSSTAVTESNLARAAVFPECATCEACDPPTYMANYTAEMGEENAPFFCGHGICQGGCVRSLSATDRATLIQAATNGETARLLQMLEKYPDKIHLHTTRSAIQVSGCDGRVDTHIPLPGRIVTELLEHM